MTTSTLQMVRNDKKKTGLDGPLMFTNLDWNRPDRDINHEIASALSLCAVETKKVDGTTHSLTLVESFSGVRHEIGMLRRTASGEYVFMPNDYCKTNLDYTALFN